jgi:DivIVA domain-containing protein
LAARHLVRVAAMFGDGKDRGRPSGTIDGVYPVLVIAAVAVVFVVAAVAAGHGDLMAGPGTDRRPLELPEAPLEPADLDGLRFGVGFRGYRMDQVDAVLDRLAAELRQRDQHIAELSAEIAALEAPAAPHEAAPDE